MSDGRVALVVGGNRGIGLACATRLATDGHRVAATYRADPPAAEGLLPVACDVGDAEAVDAAFATVERELGPVEILVVAAGIKRDTLLPLMKEADFAAVLETNLTCAFRVAKRAVRPMIRAHYGRIVLIGSVAGMIGSGGQTNYAASKAGLVGFARALAREVAGRSITVNVVSPGPIDTDMLGDVDAPRIEALTEAVPLGRVGRPEEVAAAVSYLVSDEAAYVTGAVLPVDGGLGMGS